MDFHVFIPVIQHDQMNHVVQLDPSNRSKQIVNV